MSQNYTIERMTKEALSSPQSQPDLIKYLAVANQLNSDPFSIKDFITILKTKLAQDNTPKTRLLTLELIEYTSCLCSSQLISEFNRKSFLQHINLLLSDNHLDPYVKLKGLSLIQFFKSHFANKTSEFPNFAWYHKNILNRGIKLPPSEPSPYTNTSITQVSSNTHPKTIVSSFTERQEKLFKDLLVVVENTNLANSMIDEKEAVATNEVMFNLKVMEKKLLTLPDKLMTAKEDFLYRFSMAVIEDIGVTIDRHYRLTSKLSVPKFNSKCRKLVNEATQIIPSVHVETPVHPPMDSFVTDLSLFSNDNEPAKLKQDELLDLKPQVQRTAQPAPFQPEFRSSPFEPQANKNRQHSPNNNLYAINFTKNSSDVYNLDLGMNQWNNNPQPSQQFSPDMSFGIPVSQVQFGQNKQNTNSEINYRQTSPSPGPISNLYLNPIAVQNASFVKPRAESASKNPKLSNKEKRGVHCPV